MTKEKSDKIEHWILTQRRDVKKIFAPKVNYDKDHDILYITWLPQIKCKYSLESENDFIFDINEDEEVKGIEILDFKKRFLQ